VPATKPRAALTLALGYGEEALRASTCGPLHLIDLLMVAKAIDGRKSSEPVVPSKKRGIAGLPLVARGHYICDVQ